MSKKPTYEELEQEVKALRKTVSKNEYLERVYHSIGQSIIILDSDQNILSANLATEKLMGLSSDEMKGKKCYQIFHDPEATSPVEFCPMQKALSTGKTETMEMEVETVKGTFLVSCTPIFDHNSKLKRAIHVSTDITESKRTKEALKDSEARLKALSEASFESIFLSEKGICIDQNQTAIRTFGYTHAEALGRHGTEWIIPEDRELVKNNMLSGYEKPYEVTALRKDGTTFPCEIQARMIDYQGQPIRTTALRDITDRKRLEEDFRALAENANDGILIAVEYGKLSYVNRRTSEITGYSVSELLKMTIRDLAHPDEFEKINKRYKTIIAGKPFKRQYETMLIRKDGKEVPIELSSAMFMWHGQPADMVVIRDISERKQAEDYKKKLETQLQHSQKMESIGTLAGGIAHEFNNILTIILGNTEVAIDDVPEGNLVKECLYEIRSASLRASGVVQQILDFARKSLTERNPLQISLIIKDSLRLLRASIPSTIEISQDISCAFDTVLADPTQISQVIMNLCTNAAHAMSEHGGVLKVTLKNVELGNQDAGLDLKPGRYVKLTVSDTGHGITPKIIDQIFDPYFTTKEVGKGTGMGLSVVHGIVKSYHGTITVNSELGKGSVFEVLLPVIEVETEPKDKKPKAMPTGTERILFVDDEQSLVKMARRILGRLGYEVETKINPVEALELFRSGPDRFDLVITDMTMPQMTGKRLVKEILNIRADMPIILCSGYHEKISEENAMELGIKAFVTKPFVTHNFALTVRKVLDEK